MSKGQALLPTNGTFIVTDNDNDAWPVVNQPDSGQWELTGYNTDIYDHTVYLDFFLSLVGQAADVVTFASNASLSSPPPVTTPAVIATPPPVTVPAIAVTPPPSSAPSTRPAVQPVPQRFPATPVVFNG